MTKNDGRCLPFYWQHHYKHGLTIMTSSSSISSTPFEWLSGGLFFGKDKGGSIDSCKDIGLLVKGIQQDLQVITAANEAKQSNDSQHQEEEDETTKLMEARLSRLRFLLYDERTSSNNRRNATSSPPVAGNTVESLTGEEYSTLIPDLLSNLCLLDFESRKHVAAIYNYILVCGLDGSDANLYKPLMTRFRDYVEANYDAIMTPIVQGHDCHQPGGQSTPDVALSCGAMYRSTLRHVPLYNQLVTSTGRVERYVFPFLDTFVGFPNFDVASDAMESLKLVLTGANEVGNDDESHQAMADLASQFLTRDYTKIFDDRFTPKLLSAETANYMTRRMALQILSTVLLTRSNYNVMIKYIASKQNLVNIMLLLRDTSPHITLDAFHVFKIFVANPNKPPEIIKILTDNKVKLCKYLESLHKDREEADPQFRDEKALVISTIEAL